MCIVVQLLVILALHLIKLCSYFYCFQFLNSVAIEFRLCDFVLYFLFRLIAIVCVSLVSCYDWLSPPLFPLKTTVFVEIPV